LCPDKQSAYLKVRSGRMKTQLVAVLAAAAVLCGCGAAKEGPWEEGGLYSVPNEYGSYSVLKILKLDESGVHIRLYSNQFPDRPSDVDTDTLYMAGMDRSEGQSLGMGHAPISRTSFSSWDAKYIKTVPVTQDELEGYEMWLEAGGGYF
jgi:hypothetical protein